MMTPRTLHSTLLLAITLALATGGCSTTERVALEPEPARTDTGLAALYAGSAAVTGSEPIRWGMAFHKGDRLFYRRTFNQESESSGSFITVTNSVVDVLDVDSLGRATITVTLLDENTYNRTEGRQHEKITTSYSGTTPKVQVTIDRFGTISGGRVLEHTPEDAASRIEADRPGSRSWMRPDSSIAEHEARDLFESLAHRASVRGGERWIDSTSKVRTSTVINLAGEARAIPGAAQPEPPKSQSYAEGSIRQYIVDGIVDRSGERFVKAGFKQTRWSDRLGGRKDEFEGFTEILFREQDGLPAWSRSTSRGLYFDDSNWIVTTELVRIERAR